MAKKFDVVALGEILIDFTFAGTNADGKNVYEENPGGAPANCVSAVCKLGGKGAFIGMTGRDSFGEDVRKVLSDIHVDTSAMRYTDKQHTTLAFVSLDANGERHFSFCRNPGADTQLEPSDLDESVLANTTILHVGSLSLTNDPSRAAEMAAIDMVKKAGGFISYDPNYRANLWNGRPDAVDIMKSIMPLADMVKVSEEELSLLYGANISYADGAAKILDAGAKLVLVTLGSKGVFYAARTADASFSGALGVPSVKVVDTTGAGDSFTGGLLYCITRRSNPFVFTQKEIEHDISFANAVASLCVTKRGAIPALPTRIDTEKFMQEHGM